MVARRFTNACAVVAIGIALALAPAVPALAAVQKAGANPNSAFCRLEKQSTTDSSSPLATAATKAMVAGNWPKAQKDLLQVAKQAGTLEQQLISALSSAPASVKAAVKVVVKLVPAEEKALADSSSAAQFEAAVQKVSGTKFDNAAKVLSAYDGTQCLGTTPST